MIAPTMKAGSLSALRRLMLLGLGGFVAAQSGCAENDVSFFIYQVQAPLTTCGYNNDPSSMSLREGRWDLALSDGYVFAPLLGSQIGTRADPMLGRAEAQYVQVEGFEIEVHDGAPDGPTILRPYTIYQTTVIRPPTQGGTGYNFASFEVIPPAIARQIRPRVCQNGPADGTRAQPFSCLAPAGRTQRLIVRVRAFGHTLGGYNVETPVFDYPVNVCCGCMVNFPAEADAPEPTSGTSTATVGPDCLGTGNATGLGTCQPGQDFNLDCRFCVRHDAVCSPTDRIPFPCPAL